MKEIENISTKVRFCYIIDLCAKGVIHLLKIMREHPLFKKAMILAALAVFLGGYLTIFGVSEVNKNMESFSKLSTTSQIREDFYLYEIEIHENQGFIKANNSQLDETLFGQMIAGGHDYFDVVLYAEDGVIKYSDNASFDSMIDAEIMYNMSEDERALYLEVLNRGEIFTRIRGDILYFHQAYFANDEISSVLMYGLKLNGGRLFKDYKDQGYYDVYMLDSYGNTLTNENLEFDDTLIVETSTITLNLGLVDVANTSPYLTYMFSIVSLFFVLSSWLLVRYFYLQTVKSDELYHKLTYQARMHHVTNLYNANQMYADVDLLIEGDRPFHFALGHLNNIKHINDRFGHDLGDKLLRKLSKMLLSVLPDGFRIYHFGGDEYVVIGEDKTSTHFSNTLNRILNVFDQDIIIDQCRMNLSMTFGVVAFPTSGKTVEQLVNNAHISIRDKLVGNKNTFYNYENSKFLERVEADDFDQYVKKLNLDGFSLFLMPVVETATNKIVAFECLSRFYDEFDQLVPTQKLIESLERVGRIQELDELIFKKMLMVKKKFEGLFEEDVVFSVNASAMSFNETYVDKVLELKNKVDIKGTVVIELTESYKVDDYDYLLRLFRKLNDAGIEIGIDDFGSGYSSIGYIARFPLYAIKLDKRFVRDYKDSLFNQTLLKTLISISDVLGSVLVAEGVDTHETLAFLKEHKCPYYQGFLFNKGVVEDEVINLYKKHRRTTDL